MGIDAWFVVVGVAFLAWQAGYGYGWRDGSADASESANSAGWMGEALEWRELVKVAAQRGDLARVGAAKDEVPERPAPLTEDETA